MDIAKIHTTEVILGTDRDNLDKLISESLLSKRVSYKEIVDASGITINVWSIEKLYK